MLYSQQKPSEGKLSHAKAHHSGAEQAFATNCAVCHGLDGSGTERGPNIVSRAEVQKLSSLELHKIISDGRPGAGMPSFQQLGDPTIQSLVAYIKSLQGKRAIVHLPGDARSGESIFFGAAGCSGCHMVAGKGGFIGPDLTSYGQTHTADQIEAAITKPTARESRNTTVTVMTSTGERYEGIIRNEDNFSLQMLSADGAFHFFNKAELKTIDRSQKSLMPADYGSRLTDGQIKDICSYLLDLAEKAPAEKRVPAEE